MSKRRDRRQLGVFSRHVTASTFDDRVPPAERLNRRMADEMVGSPFRYKSVEAFRRVAETAREAHGVQDDEDVATGAELVVTDETAEWQMRWVLARQNGGYVARSLKIEPLGRQTPQGGVTANLLRELSPSSACAAGARSEPADSFDGLLRKWARRDADEYVPSSQPVRQGRPPLSPDHLASVAVAYLEELERGRGVLNRLADRFDRQPSTMRDQVRIARRQGFLTDPPGRGRKGGAPGQALLAYLDERAEPEEGGEQS